MKRWIFFILLLALAVPSMAQTGRSSKKKKKTRSELTNRSLESNNFADRVWIGGNLTDLSFFNQSFRIGLTPVAAIELNKNISAGVLVRMAYRFEKYPDFNGLTYKFETFDVGPGVFARFDFMGKYFAQIEFEHAFLQEPLLSGGGFIIIEDGKVVKTNVQQNFVYIGLGFLSGSGPMKFLTSIHYNVLDDIDVNRFPWNFRVGMLWNLGALGANKESEGKR